MVKVNLPLSVLLPGFFHHETLLGRSPPVSRASRLVAPSAAVQARHLGLNGAVRPEMASARKRISPPSGAPPRTFSGSCRCRAKAAPRRSFGATAFRLTGEDKGSLVLMLRQYRGQGNFKAQKVGATGGYKEDERRGEPHFGSFALHGHVTTCLTFSSYASELVCFDFAGKDIWQADLQKRYGRFNIQFGMHSTPVLDGGRLYLQLMHTDAEPGDDRLERGRRHWKSGRSSVRAMARRNVCIRGRFARSLAKKWRGDLSDHA